MRMASRHLDDAPVATPAPTPAPAPVVARDGKVDALLCEVLTRVADLQRKAEPAAKPANYHIDIQRDENGLLESMTVTPVY